MQGFWRIGNTWINPAEISYARLTKTQTGPVLEVYLKAGVNLSFTNPDEIASLIGDGTQKRKIFSKPE